MLSVLYLLAIVLSVLYLLAIVLSVLYLLVIVLSVLYLLAIVLSDLYLLVIVLSVLYLLAIVLAVLLSFGHCVVCPLSFGHCVVCSLSFGHCVVCPLSFGHCVVCPSNYGFLSPRYLLTLLDLNTILWERLHRVHEIDPLQKINTRCVSTYRRPYDLAAKRCMISAILIIMTKVFLYWGRSGRDRRAGLGSCGATLFSVKPVVCRAKDL